MPREAEPPESPEPPSPPARPSLGVGTRVALFTVAAVFLHAIVGRLALPLFGGPGAVEEARRAVEEGGRFARLGLLLAVDVVALPLVAALLVLWAWRVDGKGPAAVGLGRPRGVALLAVVAGAAVVLGSWLLVVQPALSFTATPSGVAPATLLLFAGGFVASAAVQELIFRGYVLSTLRETFSWVHATGVSALLFTLLFLPGLDVTAPELATIFLLGLLLGELRELSGDAWTPALFHGAWNFLLGCVLSLPVSGARPPALFRVAVEGPEGWSGGASGPEASWPMALLLVGAVVALGALLEARAARPASPGRP